ncbi:ABC transporter ATP-binding protein [Luteipulveratus sp. YIM 133132]|uniref:ABC transporter ATP-binding protein n=1 Tax=Luteipulveratus flavus TaxID=3031728 RepID=A0ABT6C3B5_9MICO|nr:MULTISPECIES: ABC transporter ATP-binding protein [unclassified Luteipulveratus]MDE9367053.1 ABC transporter ATP-binding protein [Luteipulveratus sp. YIM 133132]MDF8263038.1 ABC transporter ATP-binding protein [Luteipulveratus sp. YIM 133296]
MIELRGVSHRLGQRQVLSEIDLTLGESRIGVIGANGSGKSTLARTLNGLIRPDRGTVLVDGLDAARQTQQVRRRVGFMFSDASAQILMPTVAEDIALSLRDLRLDATERDARLAATLATYGLEEYADHPAQLLSGGQKQLLAFAAVLVREPQVLVCDEPSTLLDLHNQLLLRRTIAGLAQQVVLLTHHLELLDDFDRVVVMDAGRVVHDGPPPEAVAFYRALMGERVR